MNSLVDVSENNIGVVIRKAKSENISACNNVVTVSYNKNVVKSIIIHGQSVVNLRPDVDANKVLYFCTSLFRIKSCCELFNLLKNNISLDFTPQNLVKIPAQCHINKSFNAVPFNYKNDMNTTDINDFKWVILSEIIDKVNPAMIHTPRYLIEMHIKRINELENLSNFKERISKTYFNCDYKCLYKKIISKEILRHLCCSTFPFCKCNK